MPSEAHSTRDGRLSRTLRSRAAICDACLDLVQEGVLQPSADQIAARAGLSRRSVFNHFKDLAELYDAVREAGMQRYVPLLADVGADVEIGRRIELWASARAKFLEATGPFTRALLAQALAAPTRAQAMRISQEAIAEQRDEVERLFASALEGLSGPDRNETLDAISAATSPLAWEHLRHNRGLSPDRARAVMSRSLRALLA